MKSFDTENDELLNVIEELVPNGIAHRRLRVEFKDLMKFRIDNILMACSLYDYHSIVEDGQLQEAIFNEYAEMNQHYVPHITRVHSGQAAFDELSVGGFGFIIVSLRLGDMELSKFCKTAKSKYPQIPLVLLASQSSELQKLIESEKLNDIDKIFIWTGERKIFLAMIKCFEDKINAETDCLNFGVKTILLVEDSPVYYSSYLPLIYTEVIKQTERLIEEGKNSAEKLLRQRARPKILLAVSYEEAWDYFTKYKDSMLGLLTDMSFKKNGKTDPKAGVQLIKEIRKVMPELPILLQTADVTQKELASKLNVSYVDKNSRSLLLELSSFMHEQLGFGDFIFRMPDGFEIHRAKNLNELRDSLKYIHENSLLYHSMHDHFSHWLTARTQFELANKLKPIKISHFKNSSQLRQHLIDSITEQLIEDQHGTVQVFSRTDYSTEKIFQVIGEGSLGGKARGLAFIDKILKNYLEPSYFPGIKISIPRTVVLATEVFTQFMELNNLYEIALQNTDDDYIIREFIHADLPAATLGDLREIIIKANFPLAVRSSSLLEDAIYQPFAGVYSTIMLPNSSLDIETRYHNLVQAVKYVYASVFFQNAKNYIEATGNRIEEEKMAVIIQETIGTKFEHYFYPHFSGVARSYNYYPFGNSGPKDGIINLALGLGKTIVEGDISLQYSPAYPSVLPQFASSKSLLQMSQHDFWAINLNSDFIRKVPNENQFLGKLGINDAERHGSLNYIASTYSPDNDSFYEGIHRQGPRVLDFAPILKSQAVPLNDILRLLLKMSEASINTPVEIEFAVKLGENGKQNAEFGFLQVRPMVMPEYNVKIDLSNLPENKILLTSNITMGNGSFTLDTILFVKPEAFVQSKTRQISEEIKKINMRILKEGRKYVLIGPGRWGTQDEWLGIPVVFSSISAAQVIVETPMPELVIDPSQGSHFFHNITSFKIIYMASRLNDEFSVDWNWLNSLSVEEETQYIKLVRPEKPVQIIADGHKSIGVILKEIFYKL
jgi:CheY-like chemotaxis protein